jgi:sirohydrochlorin cobaltochelatase
MSDSPGALVIAGHGSHVNPDSATPVYDHADTIREMELFDEVRETFWKEEPSFREVLRTVESDVVTLVPLFTSEGYFTERVIPRELRLADGWELDVDLEVNYASPVGTHEAMAEVIVERAESVTGNPSVGDGVGLAVVGHGTDRHEDSGRSTRSHAARIREQDRFEEVKALFMDEQPYIDDLTDEFESQDIVVVPLFIADGYHTKEDLPEDMGLTDDYRTGYEIPATVDGHQVWYAGAVGTEPLMAELILQRAVEAGVSLDRDELGRQRAARAASVDGPR